MRYWSESQFSSDFLLFLIINMQSSLHASLWKHRNLTRLRYSIIHFLMQNGVNAWINYVSTRDCWFYVPVGRCWSSGTPINTPLTVRAQLSYNRLCTPIKMYRHNYRRLSAGARFPRLLLWFTGACKGGNSNWFFRCYFDVFLSEWRLHWLIKWWKGRYFHHHYDKNEGQLCLQIVDGTVVL